MKAVEAAREYVQSVTEINKNILRDVLGFRRRIYGQPKEMRALTITNYCLHPCESFLWRLYLSSGASKKCVEARQQRGMRQVWALL